MTLSVLQGEGTAGMESAEPFPSSRESVFLSPKSTHHSSEADSFTLKAAMPSPSLAHSPRHTGHRKDRGHCQPLGVPGSPPHAPSPCRAAAKAGAPGAWGHRLGLGHLEA